jgi:hypothetical protein
MIRTEPGLPPTLHSSLQGLARVHEDGVYSCARGRKSRPT